MLHHFLVEKDGGCGVIDENTEAGLEETVRENMDEIDKILAEWGVRVPDRIFRAACLFVDLCIEDIRGGTLEDYYLQPWFRVVYRTTRDWYQDKYGPAIRQPEATFVGACEVRGSIFRLRVPKILRGETDEQNRTWMMYPVDLQPDEDPATWIINPPNLTRFDQRSRQRAIDEAAIIGHWLRSIHSAVMTTETPDDFTYHLSGNIQPHLRAAAEHLADPIRPTFGLVGWEAHQAVEQALKLLSLRSHGWRRKSHDLTALFEDVADVAKSVDFSLLRRMPTRERAVEMRAGEGDPVGILDAYRLYRTALKLTAQCTEAIPRRFYARNARFLLKPPPWTLPDKS